MIVVDKHQRELDAARKKYQRAYDRAFLLSQKGDDVRAQKALDKANAEYDAAKAKFARAREEQSVNDQLARLSVRGLAVNGK